jgi:hypothetical protein
VGPTEDRDFDKGRRNDRWPEVLAAREGRLRRIRRSQGGALKLRRRLKVRAGRKKNTGARTARPAAKGQGNFVLAGFARNKGWGEQELCARIECASGGGPQCTSPLRLR